MNFLCFLDLQNFVLVKGVYGKIKTMTYLMFFLNIYIVNYFIVLRKMQQKTTVKGFENIDVSKFRQIHSFFQED